MSDGGMADVGSGGADRSYFVWRNYDNITNLMRMIKLPGFPVVKGQPDIEAHRLTRLKKQAQKVTMKPFWNAILDVPAVIQDFYR